MGSWSSRHKSSGQDGRRYETQISVLKKDRGEFEVRTLPEQKTPELRQMNSLDNVLVARLNRRVTPNSFCTVLKALLIMKTRAAARRANAEYQKSGSNWTRKKSQVALNSSYRHKGSRKKMKGGGRGFSDDISPNDEYHGKDSMEFKQKKTLLEERMDFLNCVVVVMQGDGNCQFRSASWNLFGTQEFHQYVRHKVVEHMSHNRETYEIFFVGNEFDTYMRTMGKLGTWGDELCVRAIADAFKCTIHIVTSTEQNWYLRYDPQDVDSEPNRNVLHLFFTYISPIHYNSFHIDQRSISPEERASGDKAS